MRPSTSKVIGQCTDPYRGCIVSTMVLADWELSSVACDSISVFLSHICGRTKRWPSILNLRVAIVQFEHDNNNVSFFYFFFFFSFVIYIYIYKSYSYHEWKNAAAVIKRLPKARVGGEKRKREKRRCQKYPMRSSHERTSCRFDSGAFSS